MTRTATISTEVSDPGVVAAAVRPDNTAEMDTRVEDGSVVTRIERGDTGGLQSTVDDYVVNVTVAAEVVQHANRHTTHEP
ncbi:KEOPS complex subunit Pcc1 [Halobacterium sp. CBA1126]|uniref:KEOPS complex subunit Pcc1 n=1 Tax=Halobacterium TaxID=2239 RepID=UPI0012FB7386|nr:KEOPS complex subunit Pcc1 [Halobacterium sp. CBA1126]MUV61732.1 KEOPS complex Pcc1-like subunit [Halobacterium sp. CBA1126]